MKRTFFAIKVSEETKKLLKKIEADFPEFARKVKIANRHNPHITIKFLGDTETKVIDDVNDNLQQALADLPKFSFTCSGTGCFPKPSRPSVLWLGIREGLKNIEKIHRLVEHQLEKSGIERDKRNFKPHLTFGRVKRQVKRLDSINAFLKYDYQPTKNMVKEVIWFESKLTPQGAIHTPFRNYQLK